MGERERVQLLLWRANLGATAAQVDAATANGYATAVETVLQTTAQDVPNASAPVLAVWPVLANFPTQTDFQNEVNRRNSVDMQQLQPWWCNQMMTRQDFPLQEHLAFFWHDHFATSNDKVYRPPYMLQQQQLFRQYGMGKFLDLLKAVSKSPATLVWLDGQVNVKGKPNENFARESMELFTMGIGNYTETDVREAARACTGWRLATDGTVTFDMTKWDSGNKTILGTTAAFDLDSYLTLLVSKPATARYICKKLFAWFVSDDVTDADVVPMVTAWNATDGEIRAVLRAMFTSAAFDVDRARRAFIKNPVQWIIGAMRGLTIAGVSDAQVHSLLQAQGVTLFYPPNVGGWLTGPAWISPTSQILRFNQGSTLLPTAQFGAAATDAWVQTTADNLGGLPLSADDRTQLITLANSKGGRDGQRLVAQFLLGGPDYQAM